MKPDVKNLVSNFSETAQRVKDRLKQSGFVLPVSHEGGIKFKHIWIARNKDTNTWSVRNLHNSNKIYHEHICSIKIAVAIAIYEGLGVKYNTDALLKQDHQYSHYYNEVVMFKNSIKNAIKMGDEFKQIVAETRLDVVQVGLDREIIQVNSILKQAENLLFKNK